MTISPGTSHDPLPGIMKKLRSMKNADSVKGMARYGIRAAKVYGVPMPELRAMGKEIGKDHLLAERLWKEGVFETRILATLVDDPAEVTPAQMERWVAEFDNWAVCDGCCNNLFNRTGSAWEKAVDWSAREEEFVKRAGFVLMAVLSVHDKRAGDDAFLALLPLCVEGASDERPMVRKAVNWALRQIGKRNRTLNTESIRTAKQIRTLGTPSARWIAADALRELTGAAVRLRLDVRDERKTGRRNRHS